MLSICLGFDNLPTTNLEGTLPNDTHTHTPTNQPTNQVSPTDTHTQTSSKLAISTTHFPATSAVNIASTFVPMSAGPWFCGIALRSLICHAANLHPSNTSLEQDFSHHGESQQKTPYVSASGILDAWSSRNLDGTKPHMSSGKHRPQPEHGSSLLLKGMLEHQ